MIRHWAFFRHGGTSFGTFYPRDYIVAGYASMREAQAAERAFTESGIPADDVRAATGNFVASRLEAHHEANRFVRADKRGKGLAAREAGYLDGDAALARGGGAFLFLYAPDEDRVQHAHAIFERHPPIHARRYRERSIEPLLGYPARPAA